jgi:hypothetical protein
MGVCLLKVEASAFARHRHLCGKGQARRKRGERAGPDDQLPKRGGKDGHGCFPSFAQ